MTRKSLIILTFVVFAANSACLAYLFIDSLNASKEAHREFEIAKQHLKDTEDARNAGDRIQQDFLRTTNLIHRNQFQSETTMRLRWELSFMRYTALFDLCAFLCVVRPLLRKTRPLPAPAIMPAPL